MLGFGKVVGKSRGSTPNIADETSWDVMCSQREAMHLLGPKRPHKDLMSMGSGIPPPLFVQGVLDTKQWNP